MNCRKFRLVDGVKAFSVLLFFNISIEAFMPSFKIFIDSPTFFIASGKMLFDSLFVIRYVMCYLIHYYLLSENLSFRYHFVVFHEAFSSKFLHFSLIKFSMVFSLSFYIFISVSTVYTTVTSTSYFYGHIFLYGTNKSTTAFF